MEVQNYVLPPKKKKRLIIEYIYKIFVFLMMAGIFSYVWVRFYTPFNMAGNIFDQTVKLCFMACIYSGVYYIFGKFYKAYRLGAYRTTELMYYHFLTMGVTNVLFFLEGSIYKHRILNVLPIIGMFMTQWCLLTVVTLFFNRWMAKACEVRKILIVYGNEDYKNFQKKVERKKHKFQIVGHVDQNEGFEVIKEKLSRCTAVYLYEVNDEIQSQLVLYCTQYNIDLYMTRDVEDIIVMGYETSHTFDTPFVRTRKEKVKVYYPFVKRLTDILFSLFGLVLMSPILLIVALCIKLYDRGPVFYKQIRLTKNHREFYIYKFRSMVVNAEKDGIARLSSQKDSRITPIGKIIRATRLDEFPQLFNVLKGDMSIVGPRPERPEIEKQYLEEIPEFGLRLQVKAGLTGYAQIFGKYNTTPLDKLKLDLIYINQQSFLMDIKLILWTVKILFIPESTEGIENGEVTAMKKS